MATHQERYSVCLQEVKIVSIKNQLKEEGLSIDGQAAGGPRPPSRPIPPKPPAAQVRQSLIIPNRSEEFQRNQSALARNFVPKRGINGGGALGIGANGEERPVNCTQEEPIKQEEKIITKKFATLRPKKRVASTASPPPTKTQLTKLPPSRLPELPPDAAASPRKNPQNSQFTQNAPTPQIPINPAVTNPESANPALKSRSHIVAMMKKNQRDSLHSSSPNIPLYFSGSLPNSSSPPAASRTTSMYNKGSKMHSNSDPLQHLNLISNINHQIKSSQSHRGASTQKNDEKLIQLTLQSDSEGIGEFESAAYLANFAKVQLTAVIFIPKHLMRKTFRLTLDQSVADLIEMATRNLNDGEYHVYFPRTSIWLSSSRKLYSYCLFEKEEFELIQRPSLVCFLSIFVLTPSPLPLFIHPFYFFYFLLFSFFIIFIIFIFYFFHFLLFSFLFFGFIFTFFKFFNFLFSVFHFYFSLSFFIYFVFVSIKKILCTKFFLHLFFIRLGILLEQIN